jgi:uridine phosphorylase
MENHYPILEYDDEPEALIEPSRIIKPIDMPERCVACFFQEVLSGLEREGRLKVIFNMKSEMGLHPLYEMDLDGQRLAVFHPGVGAPLAAGMLEEVIALGGRKFIACGGSGVLDRAIAVGHVIVPASAVRDEGTSYHYLPPAREVEASPQGVAAIEKVLQAHHVEYLVSKTWTTDAFYRETPARIRRRRDEGCLAVEMEAAAFFAVARFRGVPFAQLLYGGDDISGDTWDHRHWHRHASVRERLLELAIEACLAL